MDSFDGREAVYSLSGTRKFKSRLLFSQGRPPWYNHQGDQKDAFVIGICGGSGSGKTTVSSRIIETLKIPWVVVIGLDSFYKKLDDDQRAAANRSEYDFDNPNALDLEYAATLINRLKKGKKVDIPIYNFVKHDREKHTITVYGANVIIIEGIMTFLPEKLRNVFDLKIFIDTDGDVRLTRRLRRDVAERGRDVPGIIKQYLSFVKPNFDKHAATLVKYADMVVPWNSTNNIAIDLIVKHVVRELNNRGFNTRKELLSTIDPKNINEEGLSNLHVLEQSLNVRHIHTILLNKETSTQEFVFHCQRLCRILINYVFSLASFTDITCKDVNDSEFVGCEPSFSNVFGVSILRAGEIIEGVLTETYKNVSLGKILIQTNEITQEPELHYIKLPNGISDGIVLLMDASGYTGAAILMAIKILLDHDVKQENIYVTCLYLTKVAAFALSNIFPNVKIVCAGVDDTASNCVDNESNNFCNNIGDIASRYFGL